MIRLVNKIDRWASQTAVSRIVRCIVSCLCLGNLYVPVQAATLAELFNGSSLTVGNTRFSNWELIALDATATQAPLLSQITVTPLTNDLTHPGLSYAANGQLATLGINAIDFIFRYRVQALTGSKAYVDQSLELTNGAVGAAGGLAYLSQELADQLGGDLGATLVMQDGQSDFFQFFDDANFAHRFSVNVSTNIFLTGMSATDTVTVSTFNQRFAQTGPQSTAGDFDFDGDVDGHDFMIWQRGGSPLPKSATDLAAWQANYGTVAAATANLSAIPEPSTECTAMAGLVTILLRRMRLAK
jgi:hypothetical protein